MEAKVGQWGRVWRLRNPQRKYHRGVKSQSTLRAEELGCGGWKAAGRAARR